MEITIIFLHPCHSRFIAFFLIFLSLIFLSKELIRIHRERVPRAQEKDSVLCVLAQISSI